MLKLIEQNKQTLREYSINDKLYIKKNGVVEYGIIVEFGLNGTGEIVLVVKHITSPYNALDVIREYHPLNRTFEMEKL